MIGINKFVIICSPKMKDAFSIRDEKISSTRCSLLTGFDEELGHVGLS